MYPESHGGYLVFFVVAVSVVVLVAHWFFCSIQAFFKKLTVGLVNCWPEKKIEKKRKKVISGQNLPH